MKTRFLTLKSGTGVYLALAGPYSAFGLWPFGIRVLGVIWQGQPQNL